MTEHFQQGLGDASFLHVPDVMKQVSADEDATPDEVYQAMRNQLELLREAVEKAGRAIGLTEVEDGAPFGVSLKPDGGLLFDWMGEEQTATSTTHPWKISVNGNNNIEVTAGRAVWRRSDGTLDVDTLDTTDLGTVSVPGSGYVYIFVKRTINLSTEEATHTLEDDTDDLSIDDSENTQEVQYRRLGYVDSDGTVYDDWFTGWTEFGIG